jgi:hypothetical protein
VPTVLAALTLPFLFDYTFTIYGGNLFSTLAGEYAFSFSLSLAVLFLGLFAAAIREGKYRVWASIVLAGCIMSHIVPAMYALAGAVVLTVIELLPPVWGIGDNRLLPLWRPVPADVGERVSLRGRTLFRAGTTVGIGLLLSGWWLVPFGLNQSYATSMGYQNLSNFGSLLFPEADAWALVIAALAVPLAILVRSRFGAVITIIGTASAVALVLDPQGSLYNVRLLPLWFISVYLMTAWGIGTGCLALTTWWRSLRSRRWVAQSQAAPWDEFVPSHRPWEGRRQPLTPSRGPSHRWAAASVGGAVIGLFVAAAVVVPPFILPASSLPVTLGANQVKNWSSYNYTGYEGQTSFAEYRSVIETMQRVAKRYGCGRAMWEYSASEDRFGTPESLMLLPYWTSGCVDSMEGLLFESSATTPYHFLDQAELSQAPSNPEANLPYGPLDVTLGVKHLQLLGVKYFMAESTAVEMQANADPDLTLVASTGPWTYDDNNAVVHTTWDIYRVGDAPLVEPLANKPAVMSGIHAKASSWLGPSTSWYDNPTRWKVELAQSGPASWPRVKVGDTKPPVDPVPTTKVSDIRQTDSSISFRVSKPGTPVLVKVSYFPNWQASGATGPFRVTPNLMVVVPTGHQVTLTYGPSKANDLGDACSVLALLGMAAIGAAAYRRKRVTWRETQLSWRDVTSPHQR